MGFFGIDLPPRDVPLWQEATGIGVDAGHITETWDANRELDEVLDEAYQLNQSSILITWEPWIYVPPTMPAAIRARVQPRWTCGDIVAGDHDRYIKTVARNIRDCQLENVYLRMMPYFNSNTRPWGHDPSLFISAWQRVVDLLFEGGGDKARAVWAPDARFPKHSSPAVWAQHALTYWPGGGYVDFAGVDVARHDHYSETTVADLYSQARLLGSLVNEPVIITGVQAPWGDRRPFYDGLAGWIHNEPYPPIRGMFLQPPALALGEDSAINDQDLTWAITSDEHVHQRVASMAEAIRNNGI